MYDPFLSACVCVTNKHYSQTFVSFFVYLFTVDEAIKRHKKLTSANEKQEATIVSLKKVCEKVL